MGICRQRRLALGASEEVSTMAASQVPQELTIFLWGCGGSIAVEVITLYSVYQKAKIEIPERYQRVGFYVVRACLTLLAGGLALAYDIDKPLLALNIGAATPLLIQTFAEGLGASVSGVPHENVVRTRNRSAEADSPSPTLPTREQS